MTGKHMSQAWIFQSLRLRIARNVGFGFRGSRVRLVSIILASVFVAGTVGVASWKGFDLMASRDIPFAGGIIGILFDFLFLSLFVMLFFSTAIIVYGSLFSAPETAFLLSTPARADHIFAYKFQTAMAFSSWAFLLLGGPILVAYGVVYTRSWHFFAVLPGLLLGFILLPGSLGSIACFLVVNFVPQRRRQFLVLIVFTLLAAIIGWGAMVARASGKAFGGNRDAVQELFAQFEFARSKFAPSHWLTEALQASARGDWREAALPATMTWSNGLFAYLMAAGCARLLYRRGFNRIATGGGLRRKYGGGWLDRMLTRSLWLLDPQTRLLIVKDFRTFRRDPVQWAQVLIFAGLVLLYVVNSRQFTQAGIGEQFAHGVSLMNLCATAMLMCAFMGRFIFPMMSLEGRKFWILGLLPMRRDRLLWGKFYFAAVGALLVSLWLVIVSDLLLGVDRVSVGLHLVNVVILAIGLSGMSVGLGAAMPNFRETDPSKIAVGFGGTLNLIAGLLFLLLSIGLISAPYHLVSMLSGNTEMKPMTVTMLILTATLGVLLGIATVVVLLRLGIRTLRRMEF
jgi:ABC-2 type transport system permease protein